MKTSVAVVLWVEVLAILALLVIIITGTCCGAERDFSLPPQVGTPGYDQDQLIRINAAEGVRLKYGKGAPTPRPRTSVKGKPLGKAAFLGYKNGRVLLKKAPSNRRFVAALASLSKADQTWVARQIGKPLTELLPSKVGIIKE